MSLKRSRHFREELEHWVQEGLVSPETQRILVQRYELDIAPPWYRQTSLILQSIAVVLVGLGFFLLISYNWQSFPIWLQVLVIFYHLLVLGRVPYIFYNILIILLWK
ncbi:MAG: DUF2157 domain-containing protein [Bacteroidia bacterium]|nr:DUF2157 domain-containing protein [Bacteroidia bacterium]